MDIPMAIQTAAAPFMEGIPGAHISNLGESEGAEVFFIEAGEEVSIGLPITFLYKDGKAKRAPDVKALNLLATLGEDV